MQQPALLEEQQQLDQQQQVQEPADFAQQQPNLQLQLQQHEIQEQHSQGRSLQQYAYNTAYDPYAGGVTPGFMNIDVNAVTGTHFDAGGVAVDISADQHYIGVSLDNAFGVGIARDRGYNIQIGGGNLAHISVTKDAGIGLWLLNGLINLNYMPGGGWSMGTMAAQGSMSEAVAAGNVTMANVVVDDFSSSSTNAAIPVIEVDGTTASKVSTYYNDYGEVAVTSPSSSSSSSSSISYTPAPAPSSSTLNTYSSTPSSSSASSSYLVSREATDYSDYGQQWSIESAYSDTAAMSASAAASGGGMYSASSSSSSSGAATASRRACQGGTVVAMSGSKFTCRYKRSPLVRVASNVKTYSNGIVA
jgi:hypothetical protein